MTAKEVTNIYIKLRQEGWSDTKIGDFIIFLATHTPTSEEAEESKTIMQKPSSKCPRVFRKPM